MHLLRPPHKSTVLLRVSLLNGCDFSQFLSLQAGNSWTNVAGSMSLLSSFSVWSLLPLKRAVWLTGSAWGIQSTPSMNWKRRWKGCRNVGSRASVRFQLKVSQSAAAAQPSFRDCGLFVQCLSHPEAALLCLHLTDLGQGLWERREDVNSELLSVLWSKPCWVAQGSVRGIQPQVLGIGSWSSCQASGYLKTGEWAPKGIGLPQQQGPSWAAVVIYANL